MKIISQSTLADGSPYMHLGYLSASPINKYTNLPMFFGGVICIVLGVVIGFPLAAGKTPSGFTKFNFVPRKSKKRRLAGIALILMGFLSIHLANSVEFRKLLPDYPKRVTRENARDILDEISFLKQQGNVTPKDLTALRLSRESLMDGWKHPFRLEVEGDSYSVLSVGPDGVFGTADDIRIASESSQPKTRPVAGK